MSGLEVTFWLVVLGLNWYLSMNLLGTVCGAVYRVWKSITN